MKVAVVPSWVDVTLAFEMVPERSRASTAFLRRVRIAWIWVRGLSSLRAILTSVATSSSIDHPESSYAVPYMRGSTNARRVEVPEAWTAPSLMISPRTGGSRSAMGGDSIWDRGWFLERGGRHAFQEVSVLAHGGCA